MQRNSSRINIRAQSFRLSNRPLLETTKMVVTEIKLCNHHFCLVLNRYNQNLYVGLTGDFDLNVDFVLNDVDLAEIHCRKSSFVSFLINAGRKSALH